MIDFGTETLLFMIPVAAVIAVIFAAYFFKYVWSKDKGTPEMQEISDAIETGAMAYLKRQYKTIGIISVIVAIVIALVGFAAESFEDYLNYRVAIAFLIGAGFSILSGFIGMKVSVNSNIRTASAARTSLNDARPARRSTTLSRYPSAAVPSPVSSSPPSAWSVCSLSSSPTTTGALNLD